MNWKILVFAMVTAFSVNGSSHAVDTTRYALVTSTAKMEAPPLPALKTPVKVKSPYARTPVRIAPGVAFREVKSMSETKMKSNVEYVLPNEEATIEVPTSPQRESLMNWTPMSVEAFGYDIREVWRFPKEDVWSYSMAISERLDLICDVRPHAPVEPEVFTFGGLAFNR